MQTGGVLFILKTQVGFVIRTAALRAADRYGSSRQAILDTPVWRW